jgi:hypothetical protein
MLAVLLVIVSAGELTRAVAEARPGDIVEIAPGDYAVNLELRASGRPDAPITLRGAEGGRVVLSARDPTRRVLDFEGSSHWRVENLALRGSRHANVRITGGRDVVLSRCDIYDAGKKGIIANGDGIVVDRCFIHDIAQPRGGEDTQGIATWGSTDLTVMASRIETPGDGILIGGAGALSRTSRNVRILANHFHAEDAWYGRDHVENAIDVKNVSGLLVAGNVFHHYRGRDDDDPMGSAMNVVTRDPEVAGAIEDVRIVGNVFADVARAVTADAADGPGRRLLFSGNLVTWVRAAHAPPRKPPAGLMVGRWEGLRVVGNVFVAVEGGALRLYDDARGVVFERNLLLGAGGLRRQP